MSRVKPEEKDPCCRRSRSAKSDPRDGALLKGGLLSGGASLSPMTVCVGRKEAEEEAEEEGDLYCD